MTVVLSLIHPRTWCYGPLVLEACSGLSRGLHNDSNKQRTSCPCAMPFNIDPVISTNTAPKKGAAVLIFFASSLVSPEAVDRRASELQKLLSNSKIYDIKLTIQVFNEKIYFKKKEYFPNNNFMATEKFFLIFFPFFAVIRANIKQGNKIRVVSLFFTPIPFVIPVPVFLYSLFHFFPFPHSSL